MTELDLKINNLLMEEMGLEEGPRKRIVDQDTGTQYTIKGKDIVTPGSQGGKQAVEFDPINNNKMMNYLFGEFITKLEDEESIPPVASYYTSFRVSDKGVKVKAQVLLEDKTVIESKLYNNETTCYADLVLRLNGEEDIQLEEYDIDRSRPAPSIVPPKPISNEKKGKKK